jgi:hypothetical protein
MKQPFKNDGASELSLEDRKLVHESIEHWIRMRGMTCKELMEATYKDRPFSDGCPLCKKYLDENCRECPVAKKAKLPHCKNTPWSDAHKVWWNMKKAWNLEEVTSDMQPWFDACNAEIAFLYSLLEVQALTPWRLPLEEHLVKALLTEDEAAADIKEVELRQGKLDRKSTFVIKDFSGNGYQGHTLKEAFQTMIRRRLLAKTSPTRALLTYANDLVAPSQKFYITSEAPSRMCVVELRDLEKPHSAAECSSASTLEEADNVAFSWAVGIETEKRWKRIEEKAEAL